MKKILIISSFIPYPLNAGGHVGVFEMIDHFRNKYEITFTFPLYNKSALKNVSHLKKIWPNVEITPFKQTFKQKLYNSFYRRFQSFFLKATCSRFFCHKSRNIFFDAGMRELMYINEHIIDPDFVSHIKFLLGSKLFDLIQAEFYGNITLPAFIKQNIPIIFIHHELRYLIYERRLDLLSSKDIFTKEIVDLCRIHEISMLKQFDKVVLMSDADKEILISDIPEDLMYVSPSAIRIKGEKVLAENFYFNCTLTFLGGEEHYPNKEGLLWFLKDCLPLLKQKFPLIKLQVVGKWSSQFISKYKAEDVVFCGFVENLMSVLPNTIMIVPIKVGSGIRMKILEAINMGIPIVTTSVGIEGLNFRNGIDCFIADEASEFIQCLVDLIDDVKLQTSLVRSSQERLDEFYSIESALHKRQKLYDALLQNSGY